MTHESSRHAAPRSGSDAREFRNVALVGFSGTGKTRLGPLVAKRLKFEFINVDDVVKASFHEESIVEIFEKFGGEIFAERETSSVLGLAARSNVVIALGASLPPNPVHFESLRSHAAIFLLTARPETVLERVLARPDRPLLLGPDVASQIRILQTDWAPLYQNQKLDHFLGTDVNDSGLGGIAKRIVRDFEEKKKN